jgi:hypothetical protein
MSPFAVDTGALKQFLYRANQPHAAGTAGARREGDGSRTIVFAEDEWAMHDNVFGGEPYGGRQVVDHTGTPVWFMAYYGRVQAPDRDPVEVYRFLREALRHTPAEHPWRGPRSCRHDHLEYRSNTRGDIDGLSTTARAGRNVRQDDAKGSHCGAHFRVGHKFGHTRHEAALRRIS